MGRKEISDKLDLKRAEMRKIQDRAMGMDNPEELRAINGQLEKMLVDVRGLEDQLSKAGEEIDTRQETRSAGPVGFKQIVGTFFSGPNTRSAKQGMEANMDNTEITKVMEQRGADLKDRKPVTIAFSETVEERAVTLASGTLINPKQYANNMNESGNEVSGIIDIVNSIPLQGGESYSQGFVVGYGEGDYTTETGDYTNADPVVDYVEIGKAKITAYCEMTDEAAKLPNVMYQAMVSKNIRESIRKKIAKQIIAGPGGANALTGIFSAPVNVIPLASDIEVSEIDADTLDLIAMQYGGDEEVAGDCVLILNKLDLAAFAAIRDANGKKLYTIKKAGNTGTISSEGTFEIPYYINSICPALSAAATVAGTYCMAYGKPASYEMPVFSPLMVEESRDFKFKSGHICYRGAVWCGGNVAMYKGFARIKKVAAV